MDHIEDERYGEGGRESIRKDKEEGRGKKENPMEVYNFLL
jgi:hypothetical protein